MERSSCITGHHEVHPLSPYAEHVRHRRKTVIWFISFVWLSKINQMKQTNQIDRACLRHAAIDFTQAGIMFLQPVRPQGIIANPLITLSH